jgi:hypothetical protein
MFGDSSRSGVRARFLQEELENDEMADLEEMEQQLAKVQDGVIVEEEGEDEDLREDFFEAVSLLARCQTLLQFAADPELCKSLTKRDRDIMWRVSGQIKQFKDAVEGVYDDGDF